MRILFICSQSPAPTHAGAALRLIGWLGATTDLAEIGLAVLTRSIEEDQAIRRLARERGWWLKTTLVPRTTAARLGDRLLALPRTRPHLVLAARDPRFRETVRQALADFRPHIAQAEQIAAAQYLPLARDASVATIYSAHNVEHRILTGPAGTRNLVKGALRRRAAAAMRRVEEAAARSADAVVAVSQEEAHWFEAHAPRVATVPNAIELDAYSFHPPSAGRAPQLLFTGHLGYPPNRDAATILAREVYPRVARHFTEVRCLIAGANPGRSVRRLAGGGIYVAADFPSFSELVRQSTVFACPLGWGAGSRLKLLEAAAAGLPIVATPVSAEGLRLEAGRDYLAASEPSEMADVIVDLLGDPRRQAALAQAARSTVEEHHAWADQRERIKDLYEGLLGDNDQRRGGHAHRTDRGGDPSDPRRR